MITGPFIIAPSEFDMLVELVKQRDNNKDDNLVDIFDNDLADMVADSVNIVDDNVWYVDIKLVGSALQYVYMTADNIGVEQTADIIAG